MFSNEDKETQHVHLDGLDRTAGKVAAERAFIGIIYLENAMTHILMMGGKHSDSAFCSALSNNMKA